jgi:uncharacterized membrane protein YqjE
MATAEAHGPENGGILTRLSALLAAKLAYIKARLELAGIEGREAAAHYGVILALAVGGLTLVIFGYFFLITALVFLAAWALGGGNAWIWVTLGAAVLHFMVAAVLFFIAKAKLSAPMFAATLGELKKDQEWLRTNAKPN